MDNGRIRKVELLSDGPCKGVLYISWVISVFLLRLGAELFKPESLGLAHKEMAWGVGLD